MLPIVLILFLATSALAAPSVQLNLNGINEVAPPKRNGNLIGSYLTESLFELVDGGDVNVHILTAEHAINDLVNQRNPQDQAHAVGQALGILAELSAGVPGDACAQANLINAYVSAVRNGNPASTRRAVRDFIQSVVASIDAIVVLSTNPNARRFAVGARGNCAAGGRNYPFEAAWDSILANVSPGAAGLMTEQYCTAKRLFGAFNARSNNVGAYLTAVALPPVNQIFKQALNEIIGFLSAVAAGNAGAAAGAAKQALIRAAGSY